MIKEVVVDIVIQLFAALGGVPAQGDRIVTHVSGGELWVFTKMLLICAGIVGTTPLRPHHIDGLRQFRSLLTNMQRGGLLGIPFSLVSPLPLHFRIHNFQQFLIGLTINFLLDDKFIKSSPLLHFLVNVNEIASITIKIQLFLLLRDPISHHSFGEFSYHTLHYLLKVDCSNVIYYPFYLQTRNIDSGSHGQEMHYFVSDHFHVFLGITNHQLKIYFFNRLRIPIALIVFAQTSHQHHHILLSPFLYLHIHILRIIAILRIQDCIPLSSILDITLQIQHLLNFVSLEGQRKHLKFQLIQKLTISIQIGNQTKRLLVVHFMFLNC